MGQGGVKRGRAGQVGSKVVPKNGLIDLDYVYTITPSLPPIPVILAGNVADMSRHVANDTPWRSNLGQMGPCRRHNFFDVVAVCVG